MEYQLLKIALCKEKASPISGHIENLQIEDFKLVPFLYKQIFQVTFFPQMNNNGPYTQ